VSRPDVGDRFPFMMEAQASNVVHAQLSTPSEHSGITVWTELARISPTPVPGTYRVTISGSKSLSSPGVFELQVRRNGEPVGDILESISDEQHSIPTSITQQFEFQQNDSIELWGRYPMGWIMKIEEFSVKSSLAMLVEDLQPSPT